MPPRARKTATSAPESKPSSDNTAAVGPVAGEQGPEVAVPEAAGHVQPESVDVPTQSSGPSADDDAPAASLPSAATKSPELAPVVISHWETTSGAMGAPCRLCAPAGPPAGAGSFGCAHGQWVLAVDGS